MWFLKFVLLKNDFKFGSSSWSFRGFMTIPSLLTDNFSHVIAIGGSSQNFAGLGRKRREKGYSNFHFQKSSLHNSGKGSAS